MIKSWSIKESDTESVEMVKTIEEYCKNRGISLSFIIIKALKHYREALNNGEV